jgi:hypothetical protein
MASPSEVVWYTGPVADAVKLVTEKNLVFLVYIYGKILLRESASTCEIS